MRNVKGLAAGTVLAVIGLMAAGYAVVANQSGERVARAEGGTAPITVPAPALQTAPAQQTLRPSADSTASPSSATKPLRDLVQQATGTVCETPNGSCTVSPRPINSPCRCGNYAGQIVR